MSLELNEKYLEYLQSEYAPSKIPYIECVSELTEKIPVTYETHIFSWNSSPTWEILRDSQNIKSQSQRKYCSGISESTSYY